MSDVVLIVEDEQDLAETLSYNLQREGFETRIAHCGLEGLKLATQTPHPILVLLDVMLPDISGTEVCRRLRQDAATNRMAIMMLTAKGEEIDRVVGFELGADDYVVKPFSVRELMLRVRAVLRRGGPTESKSEGQTFGSLRIDEGAHQVWVEDKEVFCTALEFRLLLTFLERRGRVQTRDVLLNDVWGMSSEVTTRTVDTHVKRLRQKIGSAGCYIETLRGVGYRWRERAEEDLP